MDGWMDEYSKLDILVLSSSAIHILAHLFNFERFMDAQLDSNSTLPYVLSQVGNGDNRSFLNPIRTADTVRPASRPADQSDD